MDLFRSISPQTMLELELQLSGLSSEHWEAASATPIHEQDVSDSEVESEASQISDASQSPAPAASKQPTPEEEEAEEDEVEEEEEEEEEAEDSYFTGDLAKNQRRELKSQFLGTVDMYVSES